MIVCCYDKGTGRAKQDFLANKEWQKVVLQHHHVGSNGISVEQMTPDMFVSL